MYVWNSTIAKAKKCERQYLLEVWYKRRGRKCVGVAKLSRPKWMSTVREAVLERIFESERKLTKSRGGNAAMILGENTAEDEPTEQSYGRGQ